MDSEETYIREFLADSAKIANQLDVEKILKASSILKEIRARGGRLFILGVGGSAANASHAVNDFRKIAGIEAYCPVDNVSELTARVNDDGWESVFANWLKGSRLNSKDGILVFSVGGGNLEKNVSTNIVKALQYAKEQKANILGIVGRDGGYTAKVADACIIVPPLNSETVTPQTEAFQGILWHILATTPEMKKFEMKWESTK